VLTEIKNARQDPGGFRRCFFSDDMDLYLWYDRRGGKLFGFQLCYDKRAVQHAITWREELGATHNKVDDGESRPGRYKAAPILVADGLFERDRVAAAFRREAGIEPGSPAVEPGRQDRAGKARGLEPDIAELVYQKILTFDERPDEEPRPTAPPRRREVQLEGDEEVVTDVDTLCVVHPTKEGSYPVRLVITDRRLIVLAIEWADVSIDPAAKGDDESLYDVLPRRALGGLGLDELRIPPSFELAFSDVVALTADEGQRWFSVERQLRGLRQVARFYDRYFAAELLAEVAVRVDVKVSTFGESHAADQTTPPVALSPEKEKLEKRRPLWLNEPGLGEHTCVLCTRHPHLSGIYPVKLVLSSRWLMVLATDWGGLHPEKAAVLPLAALEQFMDVAALRSLDLQALENEASFSIAAESIRSVRAMRAETSFSIEFEDTPGQISKAVFFSQRRWDQILTQIDAWHLYSER